MVEKRVTKLECPLTYMRRGAQVGDFGVSLVEVLVVVAIIGILAGIAMVSINPNASKVKTSALNMKTDLMFARSEAVKRNESVEVNFDAGNTAYNATMGGSVLFQRAVDPDVSMTHNYYYNKTSFTPLGTSGAGSIMFSGAGISYSVVINSVGKVQIQ